MFSVAWTVLLIEIPALVPYVLTIWCLAFMFDSLLGDIFVGVVVVSVTVFLLCQRDRWPSCRVRGIPNGLSRCVGCWKSYVAYISDKVHVYVVQYAVFDYSDGIKLYVEDAIGTEAFWKEFAVDANGKV